MKSVLLATLGMALMLNTNAQVTYSLDQLQGAWWSDYTNPTADFMIQGNEVWLDYDAEFHPCEIKGDLLIFNLGEFIGDVESRIISLSGNTLVLESLDTQNKTTYTRE